MTSIQEKEFTEEDFEASEKRVKHRFESVQHLRRGMACMPKNEDREIETNVEKLYASIAKDYIQWRKYHAIAFNAFSTFHRMENEELSAAEACEQFIQDWNYIGKKYKDLQKEAFAGNWMDEIR